MEMLGEFKNKNILVIGLARSGTGAANLLSGSGAGVSITDRKPVSLLGEQMRKLAPAVKIIGNDMAGQSIDSFDMIVVSPGVPLYIPLLIKASIKGIPVIGELELAYQVVQSRSAAHQFLTPRFIGVTGTNGKSTTVTLIDLMLGESGLRSLLGGNIGNALTEELLKSGIGREGPEKEYDFIVAEISSFQLESIVRFRPGIAAILNITNDHLDRYEGMTDYIKAKARIFENQTSEDYLIMNADDPVVMQMMAGVPETGDKRPKILFFSRLKETAGIYVKDGVVYVNFSGLELPGSPYPLVSVDEIKIRGAHNLENAMAAALSALITGCSPGDVRNVLRSFAGLEHRLEWAGEVNGVRFINDSKGTNVGAVARSLESFDNVILIMGGMDKGGDFSLLKDPVKKRVRTLVLMGEAKGVIADAVGGVTDTYEVAGLREAVELSLSKASSGDVVLLSPGCASFDMFRDFEDRGNKFKEAVNKLKDETARNGR